MKFQGQNLPLCEVEFTFAGQTFHYKMGCLIEDVTDEDLFRYMLQRTVCISKFVEGGTGPIQSYEIDLLCATDRGFRTRFASFKIDQAFWDSIKKGNCNQMDDREEIERVLKILWEMD